MAALGSLENNPTNSSYGLRVPLDKPDEGKAQQVDVVRISARCIQSLFDFLKESQLFETAKILTDAR